MRLNSHHKAWPATEVRSLFTAWGRKVSGRNRARVRPAELWYGARITGMIDAREWPEARQETRTTSELDSSAIL